MSIIDSLRALVAACPFIDDFAATHVDFTDQTKPQNYGLFPTGEVLLSVDMAGNTRWQYNFVLQAVEFTAEDAARLANVAFVERFCTWMQAQNRTLPDLGQGLDAEMLLAQNGQFADIAEDGQSGTYQVLCSLIYEREVQ